MKSKLESEFDEAMLGIYRQAKSEANYNASRFLGMISEMGGLVTAQSLLRAGGVADGYTALWERKRLDLTMEKLVLDPKWEPLFTSRERRIAVQRLRDYGFTGPLPAIAPEE